MLLSTLTMRFQFVWSTCPTKSTYLTVASCLQKVLTLPVGFSIFGQKENLKIVWEVWTSSTLPSSDLAFLGEESPLDLGKNLQVSFIITGIIFFGYIYYIMNVIGLETHLHRSNSFTHVWTSISWKNISPKKSLFISSITCTAFPLRSQTLITFQIHAL